MNVLVTGAGGQLAMCLAERARALPFLTVDCVGRPEFDFTRPGSARAAIMDRRPQVIVNAAAFTAVDDAESDPAAFVLNHEGAREVAEAAAATGARLVHVSTDYVFDGSGDRPRDERAPVAPVNAYGRSKLMGEQAVRLALPAATIARTAWLYSPYGKNFVRTMMEAAQSRDELRVVDDQVGNPTSALDLADALLALVEIWHGGSDRGLGETYHVAGTGHASWAEVAQAVMDERAGLGLKSAAIVPIATSEWPTPAERPRNSRLDTRKFERETGFAMPHWKGSLSVVVRRLAGAIAP